MAEARTGARAITNANDQTERPLPPKLLVLNQMAGPMTWELVVDLIEPLESVAVLTGHPDTLAKEAPSGLHITPATAYQRGSFVVRSWSWARYLLQAFFWLFKWPRHTPILVFSNPPMGLWVAALARLIRGTPYAVMVHDIYPDVAVRMGVVGERNWLVRIWNWLNRLAYERADLVMTLGENMEEILLAQFDPSRTKAGEIQIVYPWADTERFRPFDKATNSFAKKHDQCDKITVMYSGNMGLGHDIETMLAAAERLRRETNLHFMFIGAGPKWQLVDQAIKEGRLPNVTLLPWLDESVLPQSLATADIAFVSLEPEMAALAIPSKAFYFLSAGAPLFVLSAPNTELASIIDRFDCGWVRAPGDVEGATETLKAVSDGQVDLDTLQVASRSAATTIGDRSRNSANIAKLISAFLLSSGDSEASRK